jgi:hypothetical protein
LTDLIKEESDINDNSSSSSSSSSSINSRSNNNTLSANVGNSSFMRNNERTNASDTNDEDEECGIRNNMNSQHSSSYVPFSSEKRTIVKTNVSNKKSKINGPISASTIESFNPRR